VVLKPVRAKRTYILDQETLEYSAAPPSIEGETEAIGFYRTASYMYNQNLCWELSVEEFQRYSQRGKTLAGVSAFSLVGLP